MYDEKSFFWTFRERLARVGVVAFWCRLYLKRRACSMVMHGLSAQDSDLCAGEIDVLI